MSTIVDKNTIRLTGFVGAGEDSFEDGFNATDVFYALAGFAENQTVTVAINSGGGVATEGAAIYALLKSRSGRVDVLIEGIAASAASLIAMAGKKVTMAAGSVMMIHDPSGFTFGNSQDHSKTIEALEVLATSYARVYAAKSGKSESACREIMKDETWFTPEQAIEAGFADAESGKAAAMVAAFDYSKFRKAPEKLVALAASQNWGASSPQKPKEKPMPQNEAVAAATQRLKAILKSDEAEGRTSLAEHLAFNTEMSAEDAVKLMQVSPRAVGESETPQHEQEYVPPRRMNAQGLNNVGLASGREPPKRADLAANMKRRHGIK